MSAISEVPRRTLPEPARGPLYSAALALSGVALLLAALASFNFALDFTLGPLEGIQMEASGELRPEQPLRVARVELPPPRASEQLPLPAPVNPALEHQLWTELLSRAQLIVDPVSPAALPRSREQADVVILPWGYRPTRQEAAVLETFVGTGGGVLANGPLELHPGLEADPPEAPAERSLLEHLFKVKLLPESMHAVAGAHRSILEMRPVAGGLLSDAFPSGYTLRTPTDGLPSGVTPVAATPLATWTDAEGKALEARQAPHGWVPAPAAAAVHQLEAGRTGWLGAPLSQLSRDRGTRTQLARGLQSLVRWLAQRPEAVVLPWPSFRQTTSLAITVDSSRGARALSERLAELKLRPTWLVPGSLADGHPELLEVLQKTGEVALLAPPGLPRLDLRSQQAFLIGRISALQGSFEGQRWGTRLTPEQDSRQMRESLQAAGYRYLLPEADRLAQRRLHPTLSTGRRASPLIVLPPPLLRWDRQTLLSANDEEKLSLAWRRARPAKLESGWAILEISSALAATTRGMAALDRLWVELQSPELAVAPLGEHAERWSRIREVQVTTRLLRENRIHLRIEGGAHLLPLLQLRLPLPTGWEVGELITHHFRPARVEVIDAVAGEALIRVQHLDARRVQDFFLALQPRAPAGSSVGPR